MCQKTRGIGTYLCQTICLIFSNCERALRKLIHIFLSYPSVKTQLQCEVPDSYMQLNVIHESQAVMHPEVGYCMVCLFCIEIQ